MRGYRGDVVPVLYAAGNTAAGTGCPLFPRPYASEWLSGLRIEGPLVNSEQILLADPVLHDHLNLTGVSEDGHVRRRVALDYDQIR